MYLITSFTLNVHLLGLPMYSDQISTTGNVLLMPENDRKVWLNEFNGNINKMQETR